MPTIYQQILRGPKSSNRGFRYRRLKASEIDALELKAAKLLAMKGNGVDPDTRMALLRQTRYNEGVKLMLTAVTKEPVPVPAELPLPPKDENGNQPPRPASPEPDLMNDALWQSVDVGMLTVGGPFSYDELFTSPDHNHLKSVFIYNHEADFSEIDAIVGKERTVSTG